MMSEDQRPLLYDLFCGIGGAGLGYRQAGFRVVGVDILPIKGYLGDEFVQMDVFDFLDEVEAGARPRPAATHGSPPCQAHTQMRVMHNAKPHLDLIPATRARLRALGLPYVIENVEGAPLENPVTLCGTMFGLGVGEAELRRHRLFETSFPVPQPRCRHGERPSVIGVYGGHVRNRKRRPGSHARGVEDFTPEQGRIAMGLDGYDGITLQLLSQAIPPAFASFVGLHLRSFLRSQGVETHERQRYGFEVPADAFVQLSFV